MKGSSCLAVVAGAASKFSPRRVARSVQVVRETFGAKLIIMIVCVFFGLKGVLDFLSIEALLPYYKELNYDGVQYQRTMALALSPYAMKGLIGGVSDYMPLLGYHKKYYMLFTNILAVGCAAGLAFLPASVAGSSIVYVGLLYIGIHLHISTVDLLCEGVFCKIIRERPEVKSRFASACSFCRSVGILVGTVIVGPVSDNFGTFPLRLVCLVLAVQSFVPIALNFVGEERSAVRDAQGTKPRREPGYAVVALITSTCACVGLVVTLFGKSLGTMIFCVAVMLTLAGSFYMWLPRRLALIGLYFFLDHMLHLTISGAVNFYYTAPASCLPDGPHFDYTYFCTYTAVFGTVGVWSGIYVFHRYLQRWIPRNVLCVMCFIRVLGSAFDFIIVKRYNVAIGIPDKVMFMLGDAILFHLLSTVIHMTSYLMTLQSCPPNIEATVCAIISGSMHLGNTCSKMLGSVAIELAGIRMKASAPGGCDFSMLPRLIVVCRMVFPFFCIALTFLMLPRCPLNATVTAPNSETKDNKQAPQGQRALDGGADAPTDFPSDAASMLSQTVASKGSPGQSRRDSASSGERYAAQAAI